MGISLPQIETSREHLYQARPRDRAEGEKAWYSLASILFFCGSRLAFGGFLLLTSVFCLLTSVPFAYFGFIHNPLLGWLPDFERLHGLLYGVFLSAVAITLIPDLRRKETRRGVAGFLAINIAVAIYLLRADDLAALQPDFISYFWSMICVFPLLWLAALDVSGNTKHLCRQRGMGISLSKATLAGVMVSGVFAAASVLHGVMPGRDTSASFVVRGFGASLCFHLAIFAAVAAILILIRRISSETPWPDTLNLVIARVFAWFLLMQGLRKIILPTISFEGTAATVFAALLSFTVVLFATGFRAKLRALYSDKGRPFARLKISRWQWAVAIICLFASAYAIPVLVGRTDWDFVLQRIAVVAVWLIVLQVVCSTGFRVRGKAASAALVLVLCGAAAGFEHYARVGLYNPEPSASVQALFDTYAGADISFKTAYDILSWSVNDKAYGQFYRFLKQHTNLGPEVAVGPADVSLVADLQPTPEKKPNIFLFVIDSLRQDYVSPYNPAVDYTPEIGRFAQDSVVMEQAYTRYGGTALSEPAIWVGAVQLHKGYIQPFYPMNNLQKMLETDGYQSYITIDPIVHEMLQPSASITPLDKNIKSWDYLDFVSTLEELETKIDSRSDRAKPIFAYTQPQNVHTITLERAKIKGGRKNASIYELRRMDVAFGKFVEFLRQRGLYDNSIIILTSDHGDCYGEFGRYGHSDFLFPQVIRIPLIIHLPPRMRKQFVWDTHLVAFNADITPSLYYMLGHRPIFNKEIFGRPLFTQTWEEQSAYVRSQYLIVCSYAPVYAILGDNGKSLFIVDAVNSKNYYYNLLEDPQAALSHVTIKLRDENEALIRRQVGLIDTLYNWHPASAAQ
jgi:hypothetical protein